MTVVLGLAYWAVAFWSLLKFYDRFAAERPDADAAGEFAYLVLSMAFAAVWPATWLVLFVRAKREEERARRWRELRDRALEVSTEYVPGEGVAGYTYDLDDNDRAPIEAPAGWRVESDERYLRAWVDPNTGHVSGQQPRRIVRIVEK